ncbi:Rib/alpha-like domain-containing protein [Streptococcus pneumoniae]|uniref:Rib/alpha-like domain-containing protein n=1 Tax=Streptococcus pseudopneumoniae TaxID=257758 RepID=UPI00312067B0
MFKPKEHHVRQSQVEKFTRYSIRKVSFGAASVAVATGLFFLGGGSVQAAEQLTNSEPTEVQNSQNLTDKSSEPSKEVTGQESATDKTSDGQNNTSVKESATDKQASEVETPTVVTEKADINTASLEDLVAKVESRLSQLTEGKKTKSVIDDAKNLVNKAKELLKDDTKTQAKVDALAKQLSSSLVILNSIKSEVTEDKVNKNQDPRNGQVIPGNGESGFREATGTVADGTENPVAVNTSDITQKASELEAEITKVEALISAENAKSEARKDKEFVEILTQVKESAQAVKNKGDNIPTTEKEKHALLQELKAKVDLLKLYQAKKLDWGAPANNHLANYGNNPTNAIISNLNDTFGTPDFSVSDSHEKVVENQRNGLSGTILGSAKYHWREKNISVSDAIAGALDGWKIVDKPGKNIVTLVKPEQPTDIQRENGVTEREYNPNSAKVYDNNGKANMDGQGAPNASGKLLNTMITTPKFEAPEAGSGTVNKDFYLELRKQGTTIYKDFDVNPNSHLYAHLLYAGAYGKLALASTGEKVKLKIVDAYTGTPLAELKREDKKAPDTEFLLSPGSGNRGVSALRRVIQIPKGTTKVRVFIEAADQPNGSNLGGEVEDGYIVAGLGLTTGPALSLTTTVVSGRNKEAYGFTNDAIYKNEQAGILEVTLSNRGGLDVSRDTKYKVTVTVPQGVKLGSIQGKDLNEANGFAVFAPSYTTGFRYDKQTRELSFEINIPNRKIEPKTGKTDTVKIPFIVTPDFVGEATFKITGQNGFGGKDALGNAIYPYGFAPDANRYNLPENFRANSLETSDNPDYKYNRSIYIDSMTGNSTITVPVGTTFEKAKEAATLSTEELLNSEAYREKLAKLKATAALNLSETSLIAMGQGYSTAAVKENSGTLKVPVIHTVGSKKFNTQIDINVNVVASTKQQKVVFEGDTIQNDDIKEKITPATIPGYTATTNNVQNLPTTTGKAGQIINVETTVSYTKGNVVLPETVTVPVLVLPKATGEVEVHKGASVDKVKEVAKTKATEVATSADFKAKLPEGAKDVEVGAITEKVLAAITAEAGTNKGTVKVPVTYTVDSVKYTKDAEITVNVKGSETKSVYVVEGQKPDPAKVKEAVTPGKGGIVQDPTDANLPDTTGKVGATDVVVPTTVKYSTGDETVNVPVTVLPKPEPKGITVLNGTSNENLIDAIRANVNKAITGLTNVPDGVTPFITDDAIVTPKTDQNGQQRPVTVTVKYRDKATGKVIDDISVDVDVPVNVVGSTPTSKVVFEGDEITAKDITDAVTPGEKGTKGEPTDLAKDITASPGVKEVTVPVTYTDQNGATLTEPVKVKVTVLPKPTPQGIIVAKDSDKEKAKEKALTKAKEAIADGTFRGKLPANVTNVSIDENVENPDLSDDTDVNVTVKYTVDREEKITVVKVPVTVVEGVPQIVPVDENNKQPNPENSIDKTEYPEGSTFEYDPKTPVNTTTPGDYTVNVIVKDKEGNPIAEVPATVRVVESYPQFVPVDKDNKQPAVEGSIDPKAFPKDTEFTYETPVDTTRPGEKDVVVVAKIGDEVIAKVPAKVMVVEPKTQYVVADPSKPQPDASKSIDPEQYPDGITFEYKTPVDTTTPGEKDVVVVAKDGDDTLVEVPTKVKVVQGYPQIVPVDEGKKQPSPEDSIDSNDYPDDATFEYKEEVDTSKPGDKKVTVVVKQGDKVLVEVPATVRVVESYPQFVPVDKDKKQPAVEGSIDPKAFPKDTEFTYETPVDTTTPGEKDVTVVAKIGDEVIAKVPAKVMVVEPKTQYVPVDKSNKQPDASKSIDPEQYPDGVTFKYKTPVDTTTPGEKDVVVEAKDGEDKLVEVPAKVKVVEGKEQLIPVNPTEKPQARDSITPSDYPEGSTFEYKVPDGQTEPFDTTIAGDKPVTVVVKDKNGNVLVEVPATIKVVEAKPTPIETPITKTPLVKEDIAKYVKVPEGGKVTNVENIPDLTTPGKKDPVKVTVELPNGKTTTVEVPVNVTPVKGIETPVTKTPLTPEDYTKRITIPEGGKVTNVENIPDLTTPGKKAPVKVTVELPNGKTITVDVPVNVTPATGIETPVTDTPLTKEDIEKHVKVPEGGKIVGVGEIPKVNTPGDKGTVKVKIELPNGKQIEVEVPVKVTPIKDIVKKLGDPITNEDVEKHIQIPEGGKIISIGDKPSTDIPGERPSVPVVIELPGGKRVTIKVPVVVTPKTTPIVVEVGTPITENDVKKHVDLPEGWKITKVGEIPKTSTPGDKPSVTVEIELPDGRKVPVEVPVKVTPKSNHGNSQGNNGSSTIHIVTRYQDGDGKEISPEENGSHGPKTLEGYEYIGTKTDENGNVIHTYKKVTTPTRSEQPSSPETPISPEKPVATPVQTSSTDSKPVSVETTVANDKKELPNTGTEDKGGLASLGLLGMLSAFGLVARKKKED